MARQSYPPEQERTDFAGNSVKNISKIENVPADIIRYIYGENDNGELVKEGCDDLCMGNTGGNGGGVGPSEGGSALPSLLPGYYAQTLRYNGNNWEATSTLSVFESADSALGTIMIACNGSQAQMVIKDHGQNSQQGYIYKPCLRLIRTFQEEMEPSM